VVFSNDLKEEKPLKKYLTKILKFFVGQRDYT